MSQTTENQSFRIVSYSPTRGHCIFVPAYASSEFHFYLMSIGKDALRQYGLAQPVTETPVEGGMHIFLPPHLTHAEAETFICNCIIQQ